MNSKRFKIVHLNNINICDIQDTAQEIPTFYNDLTYNMGSAKAVCDLLNQLNDENMELKQQIKNNYEFLIRASKRLGFKSLDHLLYTLDKGEIYGYSTARWEKIE